MSFSSIDGLKAYNEIKFVSAIALEISWSFLVVFPGKTAPEKQVITMLFSTGKKHQIIAKDRVHQLVRTIKTGFIDFRIQHTARTWGIDIENLLDKLVDGIIYHEPRLKVWLRANSNRLTGGMWLLLMAVLIFGLSWVLWGFIKAHNETVSVLLNGGNNQEALNSKLNYILELTVSGKVIYAPFFAIAALVCGMIILGIISVKADTYLDYREPAFLLLTKKSEEDLKRYNKKVARSICYFILINICGIMTSVIGTVLFEYFLKNK